MRALLNRYGFLSLTFDVRQLGLSSSEKPTECLKISRAQLFLKEEEPTAPLDGEAQIPYAVFHGSPAIRSVATGGLPALLTS
jgi:hypothetical protein